MENKLDWVQVEGNGFLLLTLRGDVDPSEAARLEEGIKEAVGRNVTVLVVPEGFSWQSLSEKQMAEQGWFREREQRGYKYL